MRLMPSINDFLILPKSKSSKILGPLCNFNLRLLFLIPFRCRNFLISRIVVILSKFYRACAWHENSSSPRWRRGRALLMSEPRGARETSSRSLSLVNTGTQHCFWCKISAGETCLSLLVYDPAHHPPPARQKQWKNECSADAIGPPWVVCGPAGNSVLGTRFRVLSVTSEVLYVEVASLIVFWWFFAGFKLNGTVAK